MTNRHASKQHGLVGMDKSRPKSKMRKRRNKELARQRRAARQAVTSASQ